MPQTNHTYAVDLSGRETVAPVAKHLAKAAKPLSNSEAEKIGIKTKQQQHAGHSDLGMNKGQVFDFGFLMNPVFV